MTLKMIDRKERLAGRQRQRLSGHHADHDAANQAWAGRRCNGVEVGQSKTALAQRPFDHRISNVSMRPGRDFGHDTAIRGVLLDLAVHGLREDIHATISAAPKHRRGRLIAAGFNSEKGHRV